MTNEELKVYLLTWYNYYQKCHEVCKDEDNYRSKKIATSSFDKEPTFTTITRSRVLGEIICNFANKQNDLLNMIDDFQEEYVKENQEILNSENEKLEALKNKVKEKATKKHNRFVFLENASFIGLLIIVLGLSIGLVILLLSKEFGFISSLILGIVHLVVWLIVYFFVIARYGNPFKKKYDKIEKEEKEEISKLIRSSGAYVFPLVRTLRDEIKMCQSSKSDKLSNLLNESMLNNTINELKELNYDSDLKEALISRLYQLKTNYKEFLNKIDISIKNYTNTITNNIYNLIQLREELRKEFPIPARYENETSIRQLLSLALDGRCDNLKEAINLLEDEKFKAQVINSLNQLNNNLTIQSQVLIAGFNTLSLQQQQINNKLTTIASINLASLIDN